LSPIKLFFFFYKTGFKEEDIDTPLIDVSDIFDHDDEDQNQKPRAKEDHRKRKVDDQLLDSVQCDNDKDQNKKQRADKDGTG
jgi:hypothetical protein